MNCFFRLLLKCCFLFISFSFFFFFFFFQAEDGIRDGHVTGVQTCALPILVPLAFVKLQTYLVATGMTSRSVSNDTNTAATTSSSGDTRFLPAKAVIGLSRQRQVTIGNAWGSQATRL